MKKSTEQNNKLLGEINHAQNMFAYSVKLSEFLSLIGTFKKHNRAIAYFKFEI